MIFKRLLIFLLAFSFVILLLNTPAIAAYTQCQTSQENSDLRYCLRRGDSGPMIGSLVEDLRKAGYYRGRATRIFNADVERAVRQFQRDYETIPGSDFSSRLAIDGVAGPNTQVRLCQAVFRGCGPDAGVGCYTGSLRLVVSCLESYGGTPYQ